MKIGVALGGGGVRGLAHIQALEVIDELGIKPVAIAGTSIGSIIGALYASGLSGKRIRQLMMEAIITKEDGFKDIVRKKANLMKWAKLFSPTSGSTGLLKAGGLMEVLFDDLRVDTFEELQIPFQAVATDYYRTEAHVFKSGELLTAIRASMSIPGVFVPVVHHGRVLVDGGLTNQLPYDLLQDECDVTIAIDVGPVWDTEETKPPSSLDSILGMFDLVIDNDVARKVKENPPTVYLKPQLKGIRVLDFDKIETVFEQAQPAMDELRIKLQDILKSA